MELDMMISKQNEIKKSTIKCSKNIIMQYGVDGIDLQEGSEDSVTAKNWIM